MFFFLFFLNQSKCELWQDLSKFHFYEITTEDIETNLLRELYDPLNMNNNSRLATTIARRPGGRNYVDFFHDESKLQNMLAQSRSLRGPRMTKQDVCDKNRALS